MTALPTKDKHIAQPADRPGLLAAECRRQQPETWICGDCHVGAAAVMSGLPNAREPIVDRGHDSIGFRTRSFRGASSPALSTSSRRVSIPQDRALYRQPHRIETMFGRLKD